MRKLVFTVGVTCISRILILRDRLLGRVENGSEDDNSATVAVRRRIQSGGNILDAVLVKPAGRAATAAVLLCHGIGETVEHWRSAQRLLGEHNVASMVFDYSGYGRSSGRVDAAQCENDAVAAFNFLKQQMPSVPIAVLGFSMGSGIAVAVVHRIAVDHLILCAAFTSFDEAACSVGLPRWLNFLLPSIWKTEEALRECNVPVLIVHGEKDQLFPTRMATELAAACKSPCEVILVPELSHGAPIYRPELSYWSAILARVRGDDSTLHG